MSGRAEQAALDRVLDLPQWVDTRGMLLTGRAVVSFAPAADFHSEGETLWDVSVDTLAAFRGRRLAGRAARAMVRQMRSQGKAPVWGAVETNAASLSVARQLGFAEAGRLAVLATR